MKYKPIIELAQDEAAIRAIGKIMFNLKFAPPVRNFHAGSHFHLFFNEMGSTSADSPHGQRHEGITFYADGRVITEYGALDMVNVFRLVDVVRELGYSAPKRKLPAKTRIHPADIPTIRKLLKNGHTYQQIGLKYGVGKQAIYSIAKGITWKNV